MVYPRRFSCSREMHWQRAAWSSSSCLPHGETPSFSFLPVFVLYGNFPTFYMGQTCVVLKYRVAYIMPPKSHRLIITVEDYLNMIVHKYVFSRTAFSAMVLPTCIICHQINWPVGSWPPFGTENYSAFHVEFNSCAEYLHFHTAIEIGLLNWSKLVQLVDDYLA